MHKVLQLLLFCCSFSRASLVFPEVAYFGQIYDLTQSYVEVSRKYLDTNSVDYFLMPLPQDPYIPRRNWQLMNTLFVKANSLQLPNFGTALADMRATYTVERVGLLMTSMAGLNGVTGLDMVAAVTGIRELIQTFSPTEIAIMCPPSLEASQMNSFELFVSVLRMNLPTIPLFHHVQRMTADLAQNGGLHINYRDYSVIESGEGGLLPLSFTARLGYVLFYMPKYHCRGHVAYFMPDNHVSGVVVQLNEDGVEERLNIAPVDGELADWSYYASELANKDSPMSRPETVSLSSSKSSGSAMKEPANMASSESDTCEWELIN